MPFSADASTKPRTAPAPQAAGSPLLRFQHAAKEYSTEGGHVLALKDLSLDVPEGSFYALVGRSGCGKSTMLNLAGAMDFPTGGEVLLDGVATARLNDAELTRLRRNKVGFIFQSFQLIQTLSVVENVELPLLLAGKPEARSQALHQLEAVGLAEHADRLPHQISGGQMQRVAIARALVGSPRLLLADEPTGNLDTGTGNAVLDLLKSICTDRRTTILMATHSTEAAAFADAVVHLRDGQIEDMVQH